MKLSEIKVLCLCLLLGFGLMISSAIAHEGHDHEKDDKAPAAKKAGPVAADPYPLDFCVVSKEPLDSMGGPVVVEHEGREIRLCCDACKKELEKDAASVIKKLDEAIIKQQTANYPTDICLVSDHKLGEMGDPINYVYKNRLVRLCCEGCVKEIQENPDSVISKLNAAVVAKQGPDYPLATCPVSGEKLGSMGKPIELFYAGNLVRLCCEGCVKPFNKDPKQYAAKLEEARKASPAKGDKAKEEKKESAPKN